LLQEYASDARSFCPAFFCDLLALASVELKQKFGGIEGLPTTMLYDCQGILRKKVIGFEYTDSFETALKGLL
jgi:hypothetical protein